MTATTQTVRDQGFLPVECDIPDGMTLREYRARRARTRRLLARCLLTRRRARPAPR